MSNAGLEGLKRYLECVYQAAKGKPAGPVKPRGFVTLSRQAGAGGITIASMVAVYLRERDKSAAPWTALDKSLVQKTLEEHRLPERIAPYMEEDAVSEIKDIMEEIFGLHPARWTLAHKMSETMIHLARLGNVVLVGRGANIVTRSIEGGLHVRLIAPVGARVAHLQDYHRLGAKEAARLVKEQDASRAHYVKKYFSKRIDDPELYDLTVNTGTLGYDEAARLIGDAVLNRRKAK